MQNQHLAKRSVGHRLMCHNINQSNDRLIFHTQAYTLTSNTLSSIYYRPSDERTYAKS